MSDVHPALAAAQNDAVHRFSVNDVDIQAMRAGHNGLRVHPLPGIEHTLAVPVESNGVLRGVLVVGADGTRAAGAAGFGSADRRTLSLFASQAATKQGTNPSTKNMMTAPAICPHGVIGAKPS